MRSKKERFDAEVLKVAEKPYLGNLQMSIAFRAFEAIGLSEWGHVAAVYCGGLTAGDAENLLCPYGNIDAIARLDPGASDGRPLLVPLDKGTTGSSGMAAQPLTGGEFNLVLVDGKLDASNAARSFELLAPHGMIVACDDAAVLCAHDVEGALGTAGFDNICVLSSRESVKLQKGGKIRRETQSVSCAFAEKPADDAPLRTYFGVFDPLQAENRIPGDAASLCRGPLLISPLRESDLGAVMRIEVQSFSNPWTPVAYAMELRHNPLASYCAARNKKGELVGYVGWWNTGEQASIVHIAVDPTSRRGGVGRCLLEYACDSARKNGSAKMTLQVRSMNESARRFYASLGFVEVGRAEGYYTFPNDDAILMERALEHGREAI